MKSADNSGYIHGTTSEEQQRLALLNELTNASFIEFLQLKGHEKVLELGSGLGILAAQVARKLFTGHVTGIELSKDQLSKAPQDPANLEFVLGDVAEIPFSDFTFDIVYGRYILEHVSNAAQVIREAYRVLKGDGKIYFQENSILWMEFYPSCPKFMHAWKKFAQLQSMMGGDAMVGIKLYDKLKRAGFRNLEISLASESRTAEDPAFRPWITNLIGNLESGRKNLIDKNFLNESEFQQALDELNEFMQHPFASTYFAWNRVEGVK